MKRLLFYFFILSALTAWAYDNITLNISSCGGGMGGGRFTSIGSMVPVGGSVMQSGSLCNYSGFASGFLLQPETAFSSLSDELNPDNDLDGLIDSEEIVANTDLYDGDTDDDGLDDYAEVKIHATNPLSSDSDNDGMIDPDELVAGTSPTNQSSVLSLSCSFMEDGSLKIAWFGVVDRIYTVEYASSLSDNSWQPYHPEPVGTDASIAFSDDPNTMSNRFYRVRVRYAP